MNTGNLYRERDPVYVLINVNLQNHLIWKEMLNSSNYTLVIYLSDMNSDLVLAISA